MSNEKLLVTRDTYYYFLVRFFRNDFLFIPTFLFADSETTIPTTKSTPINDIKNTSKFFYDFYQIEQDRFHKSAFS